jgi:hypothetical protein
MAALYQVETDAVVAGPAVASADPILWMKRPKQRLSHWQRRQTRRRAGA